ncbi:hypothetical protein CEUSTIGMA_g3874.t1 [Chlamydomonas eustigma]|uniref:YkgJ family cysteine cluster protein n=1 Tax=Chlamydomonas eustigma TaxID=1157962 RepID=A0A250X0F6_9CHLO|nr:hypothetical protein CEUSTIGMA_g3874.t1 [Chlamydomonas eustigma]|eukprot:GAX76429.1 hypothetical protein CEUSTIGMA_g3874.t1 [Chlamydomonas eustigma]
MQCGRDVLLRSHFTRLLRQTPTFYLKAARKLQRAKVTVESTSGVVEQFDGKLQEQAFERVDEKLRTFVADVQATTSLRLGCIPGCGKCCLSTTVESTPWECIPMAKELIRRGTAEQVLEQLDVASAARQGEPTRCIFYEPNGRLEDGKGRCSMYETRPLICRLFGFAAFRAKDATLDVTTCKVMRSEIPETVAATHAVVKSGRVDVPVYVDEWSELHGPVLGSRMAKIMPINEAFAEALKDQLWRHYLKSLDTDGVEDPVSEV